MLTTPAVPGGCGTSWQARTGRLVATTARGTDRYRGHAGPGRGRNHGQRRERPPGGGRQERLPGSVDRELLEAHGERREQQVLQDLGMRDVGDDGRPGGARPEPGRHVLRGRDRAHGRPAVRRGHAHRRVRRRRQDRHLPGEPRRRGAPRGERRFAGSRRCRCGGDQRRARRHDELKRIHAAERRPGGDRRPRVRQRLRARVLPRAAIQVEQRTLREHGMVVHRGVRRVGGVGVGARRADVRGSTRARPGSGPRPAYR